MSLTAYVFTPEGAAENALRCLVCMAAPIQPVSTIALGGLLFNLCSNECARKCIENLRRNGAFGRSRG